MPNSNFTGTLSSSDLIPNPDRLILFLKANRWGLSLSILTGVLTGTSYIPHQPWAILFNYTPLFFYWAHPETTKKQLFWSGWLSQFTLNFIGFFWIYHTAYEFGHLPKFVSALTLFLFAALAHLYFPLAGWIFGFVKEKVPKKKQNSFFLWLFLIGLWGLAEIYWPSIFQWHMGYTLLWARLPAFHWADVVGFQGLSLILVALNSVLAWDLHSNLRNHQNKFRSADTTHLSANSWRNSFFWKVCPWRGLIFVGVFFTLINWTGQRHGALWSSENQDKNSISMPRVVRFLPIQANIGNAEKIMAERGWGYQDYIIQTFIEMTEKALLKYSQTDFIVWPESAVPDLLDEEFSRRPRFEKIRGLLQTTQKHLITGGYSQQNLRNEKQPKSKNYNALFFLNSQGHNMTPTPYRKSELLVFGEYTPFAKWFPILNEISPAGEGFDRGPGPSVFKVRGPRDLEIKMAPQICYEALDAEFSRQGAAMGGELFINVTNDSWFGPHVEPYQHLSMTLARAVENRRPLLRVTNTGFTSAIEASGELKEGSPLFETWAKEITLHPMANPPLTLFTQYGNYWPLIVFLMALMGAGVSLGQNLFVKIKKTSR